MSLEMLLACCLICNKLLTFDILLAYCGHFLYFCGNKTVMARNRLNHLLYCKKVVEIVNKYYEEGWTTYAAVWRKYVNPVYPMSYATFIKIINMPGLDRQIEEAERQAASERDRRIVTSRRQLSLFD